MNQQETIELFKKCEEARKVALDAALQAGKGEYAANNEAHEAAKAVWNGWAEGLLAERKMLEDSGQWAAGNDATEDWMARALADFSGMRFEHPGLTQEAETQTGEQKSSVPPSDPAIKSLFVDWYSVDFSGFIFPGNANFNSAMFSNVANFNSATFSGGASFTSATFSGLANFNGATFSDMANFDSATFSGGANFYNVTFSDMAYFNSATFSDMANFDSATFSGGANFYNATFSDMASFTSTTFSDMANFNSATFSGGAYFGSATFSGWASFGSATFSVGAYFTSATFSGLASFNSATFSNMANFNSATFSDGAIFTSATFSGEANFTSATFSGGADFISATFSGEADFTSATFSGGANFNSATFSGIVSFSASNFQAEAIFKSCTAEKQANILFERTRFQKQADFSNFIFYGDCSFVQTTFDDLTTFENARFMGKADFNAIWAPRSFRLANAYFEGVPDFNQAHFEEVPRLDNFALKGRISDPEEKREIPARWHGLKKLAIDRHDSDREQLFFTREIRSARLVTDFPWPLAGVTFITNEDSPWRWLNKLPLNPFKAEAWAGCGRFWFGLGYDIFGGLGSSMARPALAWLATMSLFAMFYLAESPELAQQRKDLHAHNPIAQVTALVKTLYPVVWRNDTEAKAARACVSKEKPLLKDRFSDISENNGLTGLNQAVRDQTNLVAESFSVALHNAVVILDGNGDSAHRAYGCLYGVERYGGNPVSYVPRVVAVMGFVQKIFSAIFIFLFGLALRNMLKMK